MPDKLTSPMRLYIEKLLIVTNRVCGLYKQFRNNRRFWKNLLFFLKSQWKIPDNVQETKSGHFIFINELLFWLVVSDAVFSYKTEWGEVIHRPCNSAWISKIFSVNYLLFQLNAVCKIIIVRKITEPWWFVI